MIQPVAEAVLRWKEAVSGYFRRAFAWLKRVLHDDRDFEDRHW